MSHLVTIGKSDEVPDGKSKMFEVEGRKVAIFNIGGSYLAIDDTCTHRGGPLSDGNFDKFKVTCPWHGAQFELGSGKVLAGPATISLSIYEIKVNNGILKIELP